MFIPSIYYFELIIKNCFGVLLYLFYQRKDYMDPNCLFCKIIKKEIPAPRVYEDEHTIVIRDINPQAPVHLLALPRKHYTGVHEVNPADNKLFERLFKAISTVVEQEKLSGAGYRLVVNFGEKAGQTVPHIHVHILSGRSMRWPPG
jgi:histidine triad (HIT) family protein